MKERETEEQWERAQVIVLLVSSDFFASDECSRAHLRRALGRQEAGEAVVMPILVRPVSFEGTPFSGLQLLPRNGEPISLWKDHDEAWVQVVQDLRQIVRRLVGNVAVSPTGDQRARKEGIWHVPLRRNPLFTGREDLLEEMHRLLRLHEGVGRRMAVTPWLAMSGLGGIGKTQIALEYACRYRGEYQAVLWVHAGSEETLLSGLMELADVLHVPGVQEQEPQRVVAAVQHWLVTHEEWLLILDNADDVAVVCACLPTHDELRGHVLLTTRAQAVGHHAPTAEMRGFTHYSWLWNCKRQVNTMNSGVTARNQTVHHIGKKRKYSVV